MYEADTQDKTPRLLVMRAHTRADVGRALTLDADKVVLGRDAQCDLRLDDPGVSRRHACVERLGDGAFLITDLGSTNGVFVNGRRVTSARLTDGVEVRLGPTSLVRLTRGHSAERTAVGPIPTAAQWTCDLARQTIAWSDAINPMLGLPPGTLSGEPLSLDAVFAPEDCPRLRAALEQAARGGPLSLEVQLRGGNRHLELRGERRAPSAELTGCAWDVTARYQASLKLRHHGALFESFSDPVALLDLDGKVLDCNSATLRLLGVGKEALVGRTLDQPDSAGWTDAALERVRRLGRYEGDWRRSPQPGREVICEAVVTPLLDSDGAPLGFVVVHRDVTETRQLQARLALTDRLSAMGTLSAGIAHEINNPLAYLRANLEHILVHISADAAGARADDEVVESVRDCAEGVERIARIVRDLKFFSRVGAAEVTPTDVGAALHLACKMAGPMLRSRAELTVDAPPMALVRADEARLAQVLLNLLINAAQAMPEGRERDNHVNVRVQPSGDGVLIEVADNGSGMTPEVLRRVFDPFFTTKPTGVGSGLGLSICHGIIEAFGGTISARSTPGGGTTFRVWLMRSEEQRVERAEEKPAAAGVPALRLLLVDDDARVLKALGRMLGASHHVTAAHDAAEALALVRGGAAFDLVLCDVIMPATNGAELHEQLTRESPSLAGQLVFMTGGGLSPALQDRIERTGRPVLDKPLDHARLFQVLEARSRGLARQQKPGEDTLRRLRVVG